MMISTYENAMTVCAGGPVTRMTTLALPATPSAMIVSVHTM
jgi:hypothetical protein